MIILAKSKFTFKCIGSEQKKRERAINTYIKERSLHGNKIVLLKLAYIACAIGKLTGNKKVFV